jgi:ankyrin repeat protein
LANLELLVGDGSSIAAITTDHNNQTPLILAAKLNNLEILKFLLAKPIISLDHCDNEGWTALRYASWMGNESIVQALLERGALVDACDADGRTALRAAVYGNHKNIVKLLVDYGADGKSDGHRVSLLGF